jgi:hypothetical protein
LTLWGLKKRMPVTHQQWRDFMRSSDFSGSFRKLRKVNLKIVKSNSKVWFIKSCRVMGLVPVTLQSKVQDPAAHQVGYTAAMAESWRRAQGRAGRRLVVEVLGREETKREGLRLEEREERREVEELVSDEKWLALTYKVESLGRSLTSMGRREHGLKLVRLLSREGREVPAWLERTSGSFLEGTATMAGEEAEERSRVDSMVASTPIRP